MVTTRRATDTVSSVYDNSSSGGIGLLEKPIIQAEPAKVENKTQVNSADAERMQKNLYKLLNYDRFNEEQMQDVQEEQAVVSSLSDEDIRPTSTTMQFGDDNIDQIREEMRQQQFEQETSYQLNAKGKIAVVLYSLVVAVVLALIVLNTGLLATLTGERQMISADLDAQIAEYNAIQAEIDSISNPDYIIDVAQNQYGMVKGN